MLLTKNNPLVLNLLGGPGISKSSLATGVFSELKWAFIESEYVSEYAKFITWEKTHNILNDQVYVFAQQQHAMEILRGQVDVIVTDSPLLLSHIYYGGDREHFLPLVKEVYDTYTNINIMLKRVKPYNPNGRNQTAAQAAMIDSQIRSLVTDFDLPFIEIDGIRESTGQIVDIIKAKLSTMETLKETKERERREANPCTECRIDGYCSIKKNGYDSDCGSYQKWFNTYQI